MRRQLFGSVMVGILAVGVRAGAGPYTNLGIDAGDPAISAWAGTVASFQPTPSGSPLADATAALGAADGGLVSLGDLDDTEIAAGDPQGQITLEFRPPGVANGPGWDLAVFENAAAFFDPPFIFAELAYLEVSSDGTTFARFPSVSLNVEPGQGDSDTELTAPFGRNFAGLNTTNVRNLAGIHPTGVGTAFDLADLVADPLVQSGAVDLDRIGFVRLVDIPGNGHYRDSLGNSIVDAWLTTGTGGLDLDAVGARYLAPEPSTLVLIGLAAVAGWIWRRRVGVPVPFGVAEQIKR